MATLDDLNAAVVANTDAIAAAVDALHVAASKSVSDADVEEAIARINANTATIAAATRATPDASAEEAIPMPPPESSF
jgi:hypothetical protein